MTSAMTPDGVRLLIATSAATIKDGLEEQLGPLKESVAVLVGTKNVEGMVPRYTTLLENFIAKQESWHDEDLAFRQSVKEDVGQTNARLDRVEKHQKYMKDQLTLLSWIIKVTSGAIKVTSALVSGSTEDGKEKRGGSWMKRIALGLTGWIAFWQFIRTVLPTIHGWLHR